MSADLYPLARLRAEFAGPRIGRLGSHDELRDTARAAAVHAPAVTAGPPSLDACETDAVRMIRSKTEAGATRYVAYRLADAVRLLLDRPNDPGARRSAQSALAAFTELARLEDLDRGGAT